MDVPSYREEANRGSAQIERCSLTLKFSIDHKAASLQSENFHGSQSWLQCGSGLVGNFIGSEEKTLRQADEP